MYVVIPARMASARFPGKPLVNLEGKPMIQWVYEAAHRAGLDGEVVIATPDAEIMEAVGCFGARAVFTRADHLTGTDRVAEAAELLDADVVVNVQGDEPLIPSETIRVCAEALQEGKSSVVSVYDFADETEYRDPDVVKVVTDEEDMALYFSRSPIPFFRFSGGVSVKKHIGLYGYTRDALRSFVAGGPSGLERVEGLEQLRFLERGVRIQMVRGQASPLAVDTEEHAERVREILRKRF